MLSTIPGMLLSKFTDEEKQCIIKLMTYINGDNPNQLDDFVYIYIWIGFCIKAKKEQTHFNNIINIYDILSQGHIEEEIYLKRKDFENIRAEKEKKRIREEKEKRKRE